MLQDEIVRRLREVGTVITESHLVYTSGKHGSAYVNKDAVYPYTFLTAELCSEIVRIVGGLGFDPEVVIAPAIGGTILSQWTADYLTTSLGHEVLALYAEKAEGDTFVIKRGYDKLVSGKRVLVVEDVLTTGGSVKKVVEAVRALGGMVVCVAALVNRGGITSRDVGDVPKLVWLVDLKLDAWDEVDCPLCASGVPINTDVGKGREFLARKRG